MEEVSAPGLRWIQRKASRTPTWIASDKGFHPRTVNLGHLRDAPSALVAKCVAMQAEMRAWRAGVHGMSGCFDGTLGSLLKRYQIDPDSHFNALRIHSRKSYNYYIPKLIAGIGDRRIDKINGIDLQRWHDVWSDGGRLLATSKMMRSMIDAAVTYGVMTRIPQCLELREALKAASRRLPNPKRREVVITADHVVALRSAAHEDGRPSSALAYALVYETTLRLWDVTGQWLPSGEAEIWVGLRWEDIDDRMVLRWVPSKTSWKTGISVSYPLNLAPMVLEELAGTGGQKSEGPVIISEKNCLPYRTEEFARMFARDRRMAGLASTVWARDLRASGISEARAAGVSTDDAAKVAGHASNRTVSEVYDRAALAAAVRFAEARVARRAIARLGAPAINTTTGTRAQTEQSEDQCNR